MPKCKIWIPALIPPFQFCFDSIERGRGILAGIGSFPVGLDNIDYARVGFG